MSNREDNIPNWVIGIFLAAIFILIGVAILAIKCIILYANSLMVKEKSNGNNFTYSKGLNYLGETIEIFWRKIVSTSKDLFHNDFKYAIGGIFIYPVGALMFIVLATIHLIIMLIVCSIASIFYLIRGKR